MAEQKKRTKKESKRPQEIDPADRFEILPEETKAFCRAVGLHENLMIEIAKADNDWAFILKIEALIETGAKEIVRHGLKIKLLNRVISNDALGLRLNFESGSNAIWPRVKTDFIRRILSCHTYPGVSY